MSFRLVPKSVTLNDIERRNVRYFELFHSTLVRCRRKTITSVSKSSILKRSAQLFGDYLGKTNSDNSV